MSFAWDEPHMLINIGNQLTVMTSLTAETDTGYNVDTVDTDDLGRDEFNRVYYTSNRKEPVLVRNEVSDWDAIRKWDPEYLDCVLGHLEATVLFHEEGIFNPNENPEDMKLPFTEAREYISVDGRYYMPQAAIERPWIARVATGNDIKFHRLSKDIHKPRFLDDVTKLLLVTNIWYGGEKCKSPLHYDVSHNFFSQVMGEKRVLLASPSQSEYLYPAHGAASHRQSRVNVFDPDESEFPRYEKADLGEVVVEPGDMLFIPGGWWHAVETVTPSISVNFWWNDIYSYANYLSSNLISRFQEKIRGKFFTQG